MPFQFQYTRIEGPILITPRIFPDSRGHFFETYKHSEFSANGIRDSFVQVNASRSIANVLRGLHYQLEPHAQSKLVRCAHGAIYDVAVDIRASSPTFGRWIAQELNADSGCMLYIPKGFAHGFVTLSPVAEVNYLVSAEYHPDSERGIRWDDEEIGIDWPVDAPLLSDKDLLFPSLRNAQTFA